MIVTIRAESAEVDLGVLGLGLPATVDDPSSVEVDMAVLGGGLGALYCTWRLTWSTVLYLEEDLGVLDLERPLLQSICLNGSLATISLTDH